MSGDETVVLVWNDGSDTWLELRRSTLWNLMRSMAYYLFPLCWMMYAGVTYDSVMFIGCLHYCIHPPQLLALLDSFMHWPNNFFKPTIWRKSHTRRNSKARCPMPDDFYIWRTKGNTIKLKGDYYFHKEINIQSAAFGLWVCSVPRVVCSSPTSSFSYPSNTFLHAAYSSRLINR